MPKFFNIFKKAHFWPIFPILGAKKMFWKIRLCHAQLHMGSYHHANNLEKTNHTIPRKRLDRRTEGQKDGQTLFHRTLPANDGGPKWNSTRGDINKHKKGKND